MKASDVEAAGVAGPDPAWCCRRSSRHRATARTPPAPQLAGTTRCLSSGQRDGGSPGPRRPEVDAGPARAPASGRVPNPFSVAASRPAANQRSPRTLRRTPAYQGKAPCPNQPHPARIRALPPPGRAHPLTAPAPAPAKLSVPPMPSEVTRAHNGTAPPQPSIPLMPSEVTRAHPRAERSAAGVFRTVMSPLREMMRRAPRHG